MHPKTHTHTQTKTQADAQQSIAQNMNLRGTQTLHSVAALVVEVIAGDGKFFHVITPLIVS